MPVDENENLLNEHAWCSEMNRPNEQPNNNNYHGGMSSSRFHHQKASNHLHENSHEQHTTQQQQPNEFVTLNCVTFKLEQKEFHLFDIKTADLYIKLDADLIDQLLTGEMRKFLDVESTNSDNGNRLDELELDRSLISNLYIEVNGRLVKKIDLITLREETLNDAESESAGDDYGSDAGTTTTASTNVNANSSHYDFNAYNDALFDYADIRDVILDELNKHHKLYGSQENAPATRIRVKLMLKNDYLRKTRLSEPKMRQLFAKIDESIALHVKFGEMIASKSKRAAYGSHNSRAKRQTGSINGSGKRSPKQFKNYKDCADLRRAGFSNSNITCCRETISFSMEQIGWSHWILSPKIIEYKYCRGGCFSK